MKSDATIMMRAAPPMDAPMMIVRWLVVDGELDGYGRTVGMAMTDCMLIITRSR